MKKNALLIRLLFVHLGLLVIFSTHSEGHNLLRAKETMKNIYTYYGVKDRPLLRENYPYDKNFRAGYLASEDTTANKQVAFLWPFSGTFSSLNALLKATHDKTYLEMCKKSTLPGLALYYDTIRKPVCYQSYLSETGFSDRFYDDNLWIGIDFVELYKETHKTEYLLKAQEIWRFIESGTDNKLGGGIYWCEQKKGSKNTCSNAPAAVLALKLFQTTGDSAYFHQGKSLYEWTKTNLQDSTDFLYFDNKSLKGKVGKAKYAYNTGQMLQATALLYKLTKNEVYLKEAHCLANASINYFGEPFKTTDGKTFPLFRNRNSWFVAIMLRGFVELYEIDHNKEFLNVYQQNLDYAWSKGRDKKGLFNNDWTGEKQDKAKWLLTQAAMAEMYATLAQIE